MIEQENLPVNHEPEPGNPFPGLRPFTTDEGPLFFGRDGLSDTLLEKLHKNRFVAVVGTSGSGKSSLVKAGLLPALLGGFMPKAGSGWRVAMFRPINNPIKNLAIALEKEKVCLSRAAGQNSASGLSVEDVLRESSLGLIELVRQSDLRRDENLLIIADQFEELYRFEPSSEVDNPKDEASAFVRLLLEATAQTDLPIYVMLTMRSDYLGDSAHFWGLPEAINRGQFLIPRMDDDERREAIEGPIKVSGAQISWPLVNRLLNDAGDDPRQLPILQHALMRTWESWQQSHKDSEPIEIDDYERVGGMKGALSLHADEAFKDLDEHQRIIAEKMFRRLTEKGSGKREGRLPATVREIQDVTNTTPEQLLPVIEAFRKEGRSFLMPPHTESLGPDTLIDISHESLISGWGRLNEWVEREAVFAKIYQRLIDDALRYPKLKSLMVHPELGYTLKWKETEDPNEAWSRRYRTEYGKALESVNPPSRPAWAESEATEHDIAMRYLTLSEKKLLKDKRARRLKRNVTFAALAVAALLFLVAGVAASGYYKVMNVRAETATRQAEVAKREAESERDAAKQLREEAERLQDEAMKQTSKAEIALDAANKERINANEQRKKAEDQKKTAELAKLQTKKASARSTLLETTVFSLVGNNENHMENSMTSLRELQDSYFKDGEYQKAAESAVLFGEMIVRSDYIEHSDAADYFNKALSLSKSKQAELAPAVFIRIGDQVFGFALDKDNALPYYQHAVELASKPDDINFKIEAMIKIGRIHVADPFSTEGDSEIKAALDIAAKSRDSHVYGHALASAGEVYEEQDDIAPAKYNYALAHEQFEKIPSPGSWVLFENGKVLQGLGNIASAQEETEKARQHYAEALEKFETAQRRPNENDQKTQEELRARISAVKARLNPVIVQVISKTLQGAGIQAAVDQYHDLKANHGNEYDFSESQMDAYGYILLRKKQLNEAIAIFKLNVETYPESWNAWDSLGEGYMTAGNKDQAIAAYEESLKLNPENEQGAEKLRKLKEGP